MRTVLANATVIDCVSPRPVPGASVTIDRGRIVEVLGAGRSPDTRDAHVIDLGGRLPPARPVGRPHPPRLPRLHRRLRGRADRHLRPPVDAGADGERGGRRAVRGRGALHGRGVEAGLRGGPVHRPAGLRGRVLPHHDRRALPHVRARAGVRRALRLRPRHPRADQERRGPHQAEPDRRHHGPRVGSALPGVPARRGARGRLRDLPPAGIPGDGARGQPGDRPGRGATRRPQRGARLHHGRAGHREPARPPHLVRADPGHHPAHAGPGARSVGEALGGGAQSRARPLPSRGRGGRAAPRGLPPGPRRRRPDGARLRHPAAQGGRPARAGPLGGGRRHAVAGAAGRHPPRRGAVRGRRRARNHRARQARGPHRGGRRSAREHHQPAPAAPRPQGGADRLGQARAQPTGRNSRNDQDRSGMGRRRRALAGLRRAHALSRRRGGRAARAHPPPRRAPARLHRGLRGRGAPGRRGRRPGDPLRPSHRAAPRRAHRAEGSRRSRGPRHHRRLEGLGRAGLAGHRHARGAGRSRRG